MKSQGSELASKSYREETSKERYFFGGIGIAVIFRSTEFDCLDVHMLLY